MIFKLFHKTGEYKDDNGEWDGDEGYYEERDINDEEVYCDTVEILYNDYILSAMPLKSEYQIEVELVLKQLKAMINDIDCWDKAVALCFDQLQDKYSEDITK